MDLASTGVYSDQWLIDDLEEHALSTQDTTNDEIEVSKEWDYVEWTMVVTPRIVKPDGQLLVNDVDHDEIERIVIPDGIPGSTYQIRFIAGADQFGIAEIESILAPPVDGDTFRVAVDTTRTYDLTANQSLIETLTADLNIEVRATVEMEIVDRGDSVGCRLSHPGLVPYEGAVIPIAGFGDGGSLEVAYSHNSLPESTIKINDIKTYQIDIQGTTPDNPSTVEITETTPRSVQGKVVDRSPRNHAVDPHFVEFEFPNDEFNELYIYFCGQYRGDSKSTCQECFKKNLFGSPSGANAAEGDILLLKDYKKEFGRNSDSVLYGPYTALTDEQENIDPDAWGGRFQHQIKVEADELFMLPVAKLDVDIGKKNNLSGSDAKQVLSQLTTKGTPIEIGSEGEIEPTENGPSDPDELEAEDDDEEPDDTASDDEEDDAEDFDDEEDPVGGDTMDRLTTIHMAKNQTDPMPAEDVLEEAPNPGLALLRPAIDGELRPEIYEQALAHLVAGKNIILYGPPGSGKTRIAERLGHVICSNLHIEAANAEWTYQEVVGGYTPAAGGGFKPSRGVLTTAAAGCEQSLADNGNPEWLLIDELNRANLDEAFGDVFTLLDLDHRTDSQITFADTKSQPVPLAFRILGTMNTEDQAQLFALGYAFRRRFAFLEVPPAYDTASEPLDRSATFGELSVDPEFERLGSILEEAAVSQFDSAVHSETLADATADTPLGVPPLEAVVDPNTLYDEAVDTITPSGDAIEFPTAILLFVQTLANNDVADIGQGIILDTIRYVLAHYLLFPTTSDWEVVDQAIEAYIVPQLEAYTSELRRAETVATESDAKSNFESVADVADQLGLAATAATLRDAVDSHEILR